MPRLARVSYRELAVKLRRAGYREIRTSRHPVSTSPNAMSPFPCPGIWETYQSGPSAPLSVEWAWA
jgi:hypothetical protein